MGTQEGVCNRGKLTQSLSHPVTDGYLDSRKGQATPTHTHAGQALSARKAEEAQGEGWVEEPAPSLGPGTHPGADPRAGPAAGAPRGPQGCQAVPSRQLSQAPTSPTRPQDSYFTEEIKTTWREPPRGPPSPRPSLLALWAPRGALRPRASPPQVPTQPHGPAPGPTQHHHLLRGPPGPLPPCSPALPAQHCHRPAAVPTVGPWSHPALPLQSSGQQKELGQPRAPGTPS